MLIIPLRTASATYAPTANDKAIAPVQKALMKIPNSGKPKKKKKIKTRKGILRNNST
jgi:hypothetical protein